MGGRGGARPRRGGRGHGTAWGAARHGRSSPGVETGTTTQDRVGEVGGGADARGRAGGRGDGGLAWQRQGQGAVRRGSGARVRQQAGARRCDGECGRRVSRAAAVGAGEQRGAGPGCAGCVVKLGERVHARERGGGEGELTGERARPRCVWRHAGQGDARPGRGPNTGSAAMQRRG
nr:paraneoplastic antigen Ma6E-like [Aegilops tauschii subsp. strangulata]